MTKLTTLPNNLLNILWILTCISSTMSTNIAEHYKSLQFLYANKNNLTQLEQNWLVKAAIPEYAREYIFGFEAYGKGESRKVFQGVSSACEAHLTEWLTRLNPKNWGSIAQEKNKWVLQMIDAWGKIPEGILTGHVNSYGDFNECIDIKVSNLEYIEDALSGAREFDGQYCTAYILTYGILSELATTKTPKRNMYGLEHRFNAGSGNQTIQEALSLEEFLKMMLGKTPVAIPLIPSIGLCFPNSCSMAELQQIIMTILMEFYSKIPGANPEVLPLPAIISCTDRHKPDFSAGTIAVIVMLAILVGLTLSAGILDYWQRNYNSSERSNLTRASSSKLYKYFIAFSAYTNTKKLVSTKTGPGDLGCLHGMRFLSMAWVVLAHGYSFSAAVLRWNTIDINNIWKSWTQLAILNGTYSVDTFFVMSGLLATYNILKMLDRTKGKFNVILFYIHRYIRITPTYAIIIGITATLISYLGNGPQWMIQEYRDESCRKNWWTNLLYINNIVKSEEMCNNESWYLANDMQFYILSPLIVYPLWKKRKLGLVLLSVYTILSCIAPVLVVRYQNQPVAQIITRPDPEGSSKIYHRPWSRISTFLVGVWIGWILYMTKDRRIKLSWISVAFGWTASTGIALAVIFGIHPWFDPTVEISKVAGYFYVGLGRFAWGVVIAWIIFACLKGYGGVVNKFLSWRAFVPLGRLCFCMYLTSGHVQIVLHGRLAVPIKWDVYTMVNIYFSHLVMSLIVAFFATLIFESPFIILHKLLFDGIGTGANKVKNLKGENNNISALKNAKNEQVVTDETEIKES